MCPLFDIYPHFILFTCTCTCEHVFCALIYYTSGGTDFEVINQSVEIEAGQLQVCIMVSIYNNTEYSNSSKEFQVTFTIADDSLAIPGSISSAVVIITEDDGTYIFVRTLTLWVHKHSAKRELIASTMY